MLDQFSATIDKIYAAASGASPWEEALRAIEDYTGSTGAVLNLVPKEASARPITLAGSFGREDCEEYTSNYMWRCPRIAFGVAQPEIPIHYDRMILTEAEMDRDATYAWYASHGLRYYIAGSLGATESHRAYMSLQRSRKQGHVETEDVEQFTLVLKHMSRAIALAAKLGTIEDQTRFDLELIDLLPHAVFVLGENGDVVLTNNKADRLLDRRDGIVMCGRKLQCQLRVRQQALEKLISFALTPGDKDRRCSWLRVERPSGLRPYVVLVARLVSGEEAFADPTRRAFILITDPSQVEMPDKAALRDLFGMTETEAQIARAIAAGHSLESAAALLQIRVATGRSHLKSIFSKLEVHRQQDLVRLLTSLSLIKL